MVQEIKKVVVVGGTGSIGSVILKTLLESNLTVTVLSRPDSKSTFPAGVNVIKKAYDDPTLGEAFAGQDGVISAVGGAALLDQTKLIDAAVKAGVKRFLPSEFGTNTLDEKVQELVFLYKQKISVIEHLKKAAASNPGFSWTGLATGPFLDWGITSGFLGYDIKSESATIYDSGDVLVSYTNLSTIALAVLRIFERPAETANKFLFVASATVTQNQLLASIEKASGKKWTVTKANTEEAGKIGGEKVAKGDFSGFQPLLARLIYGGDPIGDFRKLPGGLANGILGLPEEDLDEVVRDTLAGKRP